MRSPQPWLADFFQFDPAKALAALRRAEAESSGAVSRVELFERGAQRGERRGAPKGLFDPALFGPSPERFGHVVVGGVTHPAVLTTLEVELGLPRETLFRIVRGELSLRDGVPAEGDVERPGPRTLAEALRAKHPAHPFLPLCAMTFVPVPPLAARPLVASKGRPEFVDPSLGPVNEAWLGLIHRAARERALVDAGAPPLLVVEEARSVQRAFELVFERTQQSFVCLLPGLERGKDAALRAILFVSDEHLLLQHGDGVRLVDLDGRVLRSLAPSACQLTGVVERRYAVFTKLDHELHPQWCEDRSVWPAWFVSEEPDGVVETPPFREVSLLDLESGEYLSALPPSVPDSYPENDQPEDLFFKGRPLFVGGDRPSALCYSPDLRFALVGENDDTQIIELESGITAAFPSYAYDASSELELESGRVGEPTFGFGDFGGGVAIAFADGAWRIVQPEGVLTDHRGRDPLLLEPPPAWAAFSPSGRLLAVGTTPRSDETVSDDDSGRDAAKTVTITIVDVARRRVLGRFPAR